MCGRFNIIDNPSLRALLNRLGVDLGAVRNDSLTAFNIAPTENVMTVHPGEEGNRLLTPAVWWFLLKQDGDRLTPDHRFASFNARAERMFSSRLYRRAARHGRCIVPAAGYYEWISRQGVRVPHYLQPESGEIAFAGLYQQWSLRGETVTSTSIVTTPAHPALSWLHEKSTPLMLHEADFDRWLDPSVQTERELEDFWQPRLHGRLRFYPVSSEMNNARNKSEVALEPAGEVVTIGADYRHQSVEGFSLE